MPAPNFFISREYFTFDLTAPISFKILTIPFLLFLESNNGNSLNKKGIKEIAKITIGRIEFCRIEKYNIVGAKEIDNLKLANIVAKHIQKKLLYKFVDFHSSRPGHDLRYAISGKKLKKMGWQPKKDIENRIKDTVNWTLKNKEWF